VPVQHSSQGSDESGKREMASEVEFTEKRNGIALAYRHESAEAPATGVLWLGGFMSDMAGAKAEAVAAAARKAGRPCLRFDYSGHGLSEGHFTERTISDWLGEAQYAFEQIARGPMIIAGSSMGGYLALLMVRRLAAERSRHLGRIRGLMLIAPAVDMSEALLWASLDEEARRAIETRGEWLMPSRYGEGYRITRKLIEDGRHHLILRERTKVDVPVRILQGEADPDVPWRHGLTVYERLEGDDITFTLIKGGDHRLSSPRDLETIVETIQALWLRASLSER
jgi:alpha-beta hydrolase superfamily lysophospholipase